LEAKGFLYANHGGIPRPLVGQSTEFRKKKASAWKQVGVAAPSSSEQAEADALIAAAAAENQARAEADDEAPAVVEDNDGDEDELPARKGGLQSAADVRAASERKRKAEKAQIEADVAALGGKGQETIYRDASGRVINIAMKRAEARKKAEEEERKKAEEEEAARGDVQRTMKEARKLELEEAKYLTVARTEDDVTMNEALKERARWNDPAAGFLSTKKSEVKKSRDSKTSKPSKPTYQGTFDPNRYGLRPGYRWDGVDRGNGFEKKWFAARNRRQDRQEMEYAWQMDE
jgi:pre-mRNA-splicing factor CWC26